MTTSTPESDEKMILKVLDCCKFGEFSTNEGEAFPLLAHGSEALKKFAFKHGIDSKLLFFNEFSLRDMTYGEAYARAEFLFGIGDPPVINTNPRVPC